jgi:exosortase/archaeosortase family protein
VLGVTLILLNLKATLALLLPILFMFFLVPLPEDFVYALGGAMGNFNTQASYSVLKTFGLPVMLSTSYGPPTLVLTSSQGVPASFTVDVPCSGIYSLIAFAMFAAFLLLVTSASAPRKIAAVLVGFIIFEVFNVIRITTIVSVAYQFGQAIAMNLVHAMAGLLLIFIGMLLTLFIAEKVFKVQVMPPTKQNAPCPSCETSLQKHESFCFNCGKPLNHVKTSVSKEFWAKVLLLILICFIVTLSINAPTFAIAQGPKGTEYTENWASATNLFPNFTGYQPDRFLYEDFQYEQIAHQDASLWYVYYSTNFSQPSVYIDVGIADSISNLHNWEVCLVSYEVAQGQSPLVNVLDSRDIELLPDVPLIGQYFTFTSPANYTQVTLYWYEKATFDTGITVGQKYVRISLIIVTQNATNAPQIEDQLLPIGQAIASYWQPLINSSLISLGVPTLQALLVVSLFVLAFTETTRYFSEWTQRNKNQKLFDSFASKDEKAILKTLQEITAEKKTTRTADIQEALERNTHKSIDEDTLHRILTHLEKYGFIKKDLTSIDNRPVLIWKT